MIKKILYVLLAALVVVQFIRPERNVSAAAQPNHISNKYAIPENVKGILQKACYDCHSNNTVYPWYTNIQPLGFWIQHHVDEGKGEINFDEFLTYKPKKAHHKMEECIEMVKEKEMPLNSYTWIHGDARLTTEERTAITDWASLVMQQIVADSSAAH